MTQAAAFAGAAVVAQVVESAMEARRRNNLPVSHSSPGIGAQQGCDNEGQYPCVTIARKEPDFVPGSGANLAMNEDEARAYVVDFINGVRKLNDLEPLVRDPLVDAFAQSSSEALSTDHKPGQFALEHGAELVGRHGEAQTAEDGAEQKPLGERVGAILLSWMAEKPEGAHRGVVVRPEWRRVGVGIVTQDGRTYFTVDFSS
jgi:uncharacterized protein YkwD